MSKSDTKTGTGSNSAKTFQDKELERMMVSGEEVILRADLHMAIYWKAVAVLLFALLLMFFVWPIGLLVAVAGGLMLCVAILTQHFCFWLLRINVFWRVTVCCRWMLSISA